MYLLQEPQRFARAQRDVFIGATRAEDLQRGRHSSKTAEGSWREPCLRVLQGWEGPLQSFIERDAPGTAAVSVSLIAPATRGRTHRARWCIAVGPKAEKGVGGGVGVCVCAGWRMGGLDGWKCTLLEAVMDVMVRFACAPGTAYQSLGLHV